MNSEELQVRFRAFIKEYGVGVVGWGLISENEESSHFLVSIAKKQFKEISEKLPKDFEGIEIKTQKMLSLKFL